MTAEVIGREAELGAVEAFLDRPQTGPAALVVAGDAGIGKSTLWSLAVETARARSFTVLASRPAEAERQLDHVVLADLFDSTPADIIAGLPAPRRIAFETALLTGGVRDGGVDPLALGVAIRSVVAALASEHPLVLAIDDEQWADASSVAALRFALRRLEGEPVALLLSRRAAPRARPGLEADIDPTRVERIGVGPLSLGAIQLLLRHRLNLALPRPMLVRIHEASGGNPFYALELARAQTADADHDPTGRLAIPANLERLLAARIDAVDAPTRRALLLIAAHGRTSRHLLRTLGVGERELALAEAQQLVAEREATVRFTHPLLGSTLYQQASPEERRAAHRHLVGVIVDPVERARHLALASEAPTPALAAELEAAASTAWRRGSPVPAAELAEHARRLTPAVDAEGRRRRALFAARAHLAAGNASRANALIADLLRTTPSGRGHAEVLALASLLDEPDDAVARLEEALVEADGDQTLTAELLLRLAQEGRMTRGNRWAEQQARAAAEIGERLDNAAIRARSQVMLATFTLERGDPGSAEQARLARRLAGEVGEPELEAFVVRAAAHVVAWAASPVEAAPWLTHELGAWTDRDELVRAELLWYLAMVEVWSGRWADAEAHAAMTREIEEQYRGEQPTWHLPVALAALRRGQLADAAAHSRHALSLGWSMPLPSHTAILGVAALWSGDPNEAVVRMADAERLADRRGRNPAGMREWRAEYVEALLELGRIQDARHLTDAWDRSARHAGNAHGIAAVTRCRGLVAAADGDLETARTVLEEAALRAAAAGDPFGRGRALLALGGVERRRRQKRAARAALQAALDQFMELGAATWVATTRHELGRIGGRQRIEGLSPSEERVAALVAEGRTNREIAAILFLGERTVASHLTHIYAKLGIRSRTELTRRISREEAAGATTGNIPTS